MVKPVKVETVKEIQDKVSSNEMIVLVDYRGIDVNSATELRKKLRESNVDYKVYKNTLFKRALSNLKIEGCDEVLEGPTAFAFSNDVVAPAKILYEYAKENETFIIKGAIHEKSLISEDEIRKYSTIPGREDLLTKLLYIMKSAQSAFVRVVDAIAKKQAESQPEPKAEEKKEDSTGVPTPGDKEEKQPEAAPVEEAKPEEPKTEEKPAEEASVPPADENKEN